MCVCVSEMKNKMQRMWRTERFLHFRLFSFVLNEMNVCLYVWVCVFLFLFRGNCVGIWRTRCYLDNVNSLSFGVTFCSVCLFVRNRFYTCIVVRRCLWCLSKCDDVSFSLSIMLRLANLSLMSVLFHCIERCSPGKWDDNRSDFCREIM